MKEIILTKGCKALVDDEDYERINKFRWNFQSGRAGRSIGGRKNKVNFMLHWAIIGKPKKGFVVDHIDNNPLNNTRSNLRICTPGENAKNSKQIGKNNTSGYKGVKWDKARNKWMASIMVEYRNKFLGRFESKEKAAICYNKAAKKYFGAFAKLNIIKKI